jgi:hypothetical protein
VSIFDHPDDVPPVATWRCPHCATLQPESTRCWACERTPMTCATCRYFRKSVIGPVGFCGLDRTRSILSGDEVRTCWQPPTDVVDLVSDRPGSGRTSWRTLAERQRGGVGASGSTAGTARTTERPTARSTPSLAALPIDPGAPPSAPGPGDPTSSGRPMHAITVYDEDDLIEAPVVPPARKLTWEAQRRSQARRERLSSAADLERPQEAIDPAADG